MPSIANPLSPRTRAPSDAVSREAKNSSRKMSNPRKDVAKKIQLEQRTAAAPAVLNGQNLSPPVSPRVVNPSSRDDLKLAARVAVPRNSSMDSAVSSVSTSADGNRSKEALEPNSQEMQQLIAAAGSPEILIAQLLKDKNHTAAQNAQLWKLIDKQRALLLGLNQDLERALKDKEKYRHRAKDLHTALETAKLVEIESRRAQEARVAEAATVNTPNFKSMSSMHSSPLDPSMLPSPLHLLQTEPKKSSHLREATGGKQTVDSDDTVDTESTSSIERLVARKDSETLATVVPEQQQAPTEKTVAKAMPNPKPTKGSEEKKSAARKAPPAPLNLNQARPMQSLAAVARPGPEDERSERGRRKTREEDDVDRELAAKYEQEARSRSSKSSKSSKSGKRKAKQDGKTEAPARPPPAVPVDADLPEIPLGVEPVMNAPSVDPSMAPSQSIASVLAPATQPDTTVERVLVSPPPMSPGLPLSPRPIDRPVGAAMPRMPKDSSLMPVSPALPLSPRGAPGLPLSPRPPKSPLPVPVTPGAMSPQSHQTTFHPRSPRATEFSKPTVTAPAPENDSPTSVEPEPSSPFAGMLVDRSLMNPANPNLLVTPATLSAVFVQVASSRLRPKRNSYMPTAKPSEEEPVFTMSIFSHASGKEMWRIEKGIMALPQLDQQMKGVSKFATKLPERKLFSGHSPAVVDARRQALNHYFGELMEAAIDEPSKMVVASFLSNDVIEARDDETSMLAPSQRSRTGLALTPDGRPKKEGYLTKRGKNFGGWKVRFFVLHGSELKYFESPNGSHLGTIKLQHAQIGKQTQNPSPSRGDDDVENQYRHAFLVLEPKRKDSSSLVRHVLCAESDHERDEWVSVLMQNADYPSDEEKAKPTSKRLEDGKGHITGFEAKVRQYAPQPSKAKEEPPAKAPAKPEMDELRGIGYEQVAAGTAPAMGNQQIDPRQDSPSPVSTGSMSVQQESLPVPQPMQVHEQPSQGNKNISAPKHGQIIHDAVHWGNNNVNSLMSSVKENVKEKKRSMWGFRQRSGPEVPQNPSLQSYEAPVSYQSSQGPTVRAVFGLPLVEAVEFCPPTGINVHLPAVVYRCIEYLHAKDAASEEGIFRLSGSNLVIKSLRERFNTEGDVNFLAETQYYDVHAVASLFKAYLRELPSTVLTKELHLDFLHVLELDDKSQKIAAFNMLVHRLPHANLVLLRALSQYLIEVVNNSDKNKMNVRNIVIVFSPTLNIPAPVFGMFLTDFDAIFGEAPAPEPQSRTVEIKMPAQSSDEIRSPRRQMFSDLPTPAYNQTSFPAGTGQSNASHPSNGVSQDTGFIPLQPSYETRTTFHSDSQGQRSRAPSHPAPAPPAPRGEYGSMNSMLMPSNAASVKAKRRESSMLFMGMGNRRKEDQGRKSAGIHADF